jgi:hypothetical protein
MWQSAQEFYQARTQSERNGVGFDVEAQHWPYHFKSTMPALQFQAPRGTQDILPDDAPYWAFVEDEMRRQARLANYGEIRTPTFEDTGVFQRCVGATTDIVEKEMYTFLD